MHAPQAAAHDVPLHAAGGYGGPPGGFGGPPPGGGFGGPPPGGGFGGPPPGGGFGGPPPGGGFGGPPPGGGGWGNPPGGFGGAPGGFGSPPGAPPGGGDVAGSANTWFILSILCTLLCCLPAGVVGIIFTNDAKNLAAQGDYATADQKLSTGRVAVIVGIALAALAWVGYLLLFVIGAIASF